jgi:acyl carrier protein phosphodiesterase
MTKSKIQNNPVNGPWPIIHGFLKKFKTIDYRPSAIEAVIYFNICVLTLFFALCFGICQLDAKEDNKLVTLSKQIIDFKSNQDLYIPFEELKDLYLKDNKYNEFVDFLKSLGQKKKALEPFINYYIALSRYRQLKYLEEIQNWDEYFSQANTYRDQITEGSQKVIESINVKEPLHIYARLILWQFHKDQQDVFCEQALTNLMNSVSEYAKDGQDIKPLKEVADKLSDYGEKGKAKELYRIYVAKLTTSDIKDKDLNNVALGFYKEGNLDLAQNLYDVYMERMAKSSPKEKLIPLLIDIAKSFSYAQDRPYDALYADKIYQKIEDIGGKESLNEELIYLRAFGLEKMKEYAKAKDIYIELVQRYPRTTHADEAVFKAGLIYTYILRDINSGKTYFEKLAQKESVSPQVISSLYQLGLLNQWQEDLVKAKDYYNKLIEKAKDQLAETVSKTQERLKEIEEAKPLEYNLKTFLDVCLKEEYAGLDMTKVDLKAHPYMAKKDESIEINSQVFLAESGCFQVELQYLWSGHTGTKNPSSAESSFATAYAQRGTKEINLVVVSPTGIIDRNMDIVDAY